MDDQHGLVLRLLMPGFTGTEVPEWLDDALRDGLASVCLYGSNVESRDQLRDLCADLRRRAPHVVVAVDEEGGDVTRLHYRTGSPYVGNAVLGRLDDVEATAAAAREIAADLRAAGVDLDLAPVVDVNSSDDNPVIGTRSFGADPQLVARHSAAWITALQEAGIGACAKHFPGHGDTTADSHLSLPVVDVDAATLRSRELAPFAAAVAAGAECVMTAAIVVPSIDPGTPGTFSAPLLQGVLRHELGYGGVVVTDALDMAGASAETGIPEAAVRAVVAGCDLLCLGSDTDPALFGEIVDALGAAVASGRIPHARLEAAAGAVSQLVSSRGAARGAALPAEEPAPASVLADVVRAFVVSAAAREWLAAPGPAAIVQIGTGSNLAVGGVPWGPASVGRVSSDGEVLASPRVAVVGRDLVPGHPALAEADRLRSEGKAVITVECGWPRGGGGSAYGADIVTYGGSPAVAGPLAELLLGGAA